MWFWRAFIFSLSIALFAAISSPACAADNTAPLQHSTVLICDTQPNTDISADLLLSEQNNLADFLAVTVSDKKDTNKQSPYKTPVYQSIFHLNVSLPAFERQAASAFATVSQNAPIFALAYEFLAEILGLKHFLAPLSINRNIPWYLRSDLTNSHGRLAGWKDGNSLYASTITYLS
ncbi:hypothetical protein [Paraglaciecola sp. L3A3]|uniref:hypothetical protein n=1 Tax=Paraglaciecola sp. L3A3 TaxID=2686358 RepID=UPI00131C2625|nr:hypothetical protein [Paraglaciecola sp. L3A3]